MLALTRALPSAWMNFPVSMVTLLVVIQEVLPHYLLRHPLWLATTLAFPNGLGLCALQEALSSLVHCCFRREATLHLSNHKDPSW